MLRSFFSTRSRNNRSAKSRLAIEPLETRTVLSATRTLDGLEFLADANFTTETVSGQVHVRAEGPVEVGLAPTAGQQFSPLLRLTGGVDFVVGNATGQFTAEGAIVGIIGGHEIPLAASATREFSASDLLGQGTGIGGGQSISVAGASFALSSVELTGGAVELQGHLDLPQLAGLTVAVEGDDHVVIDRSGVHLTGLDASVTGSFGLLGLKVDADEVGVKYNAASDTFGLFGGIHISTPGKTFDHVGATLGSMDDPGLMIVHGQVQELNVGVDGTINLYGLAFSSKGLRLHYDAPSGLLRLVGGLGFQIGQSFSAAATLTGDGVTIDTRSGAVMVSGVKFEADASFGPVQIQGLTIEYQNTPTGSVWAASGIVQLAPGVAVGGAFTIANGKLTQIEIDYDAGTGAGIPVGDTGAYLTKIGGGIDHLDDPAKIVVALKAEVTYGKTVHFLGKDYGLFVADGTLTVSKDQFDMDGNVQIVGGILGEGTAHVTLDLINKVVRVRGNLSMYDGVFTYGAGVTITAAGDVTVDGRGAVNLPKLPKAIQELASFLPTNALGHAYLRLEIHPGRPADTFVAAEATAFGLTGKFRYDASNGFSFGTFRGVAQFATAAINAAGEAITKSYDEFGNMTEGWSDKAGHTWKRVTQSFNPGQIGATYVTEYANGVRYLRNSFSFGYQTAREVWQDGWDAGVVGAQYVKQVFGSNARTITTTLESGGKAIRQTAYASGKTVLESLDASGHVVETLVKDSANSAWKKTTSALSGLKFW